MSELRSRILTAPDIKKETIHIPEWGVDVDVWGLTSKQRAECVEAATVTDDEGNSSVSDTAILIPLVIAATHEVGKETLVFQREDRDALEQKSAAAVERIAKAVLRMSGMSPAEQEKIRGNSPGTPSVGSTSG